jgi:hypothetical protein
MIGSSTAEGLEVLGNKYREPFLATHRALAVCTRELASLSDEVVRAVKALSGTTVPHKAVVRQSPDRCIVQLGPVALTLAWLRSNQDSIATGELLVIVWHGAVAPRVTYEPERPDKHPAPLAATSLWEQVLTVSAASEAEWGWQPRDAGAGRCTSPELAARCVERLHVAYLETGEPPREEGSA